MTGGSVVTNLGYNIKVNDGSKLARTWFIVNDNICPIQLSGSGITTSYDSSDRNYAFNPYGRFEIKEEVAAFQVRFMLFDIWNNT